MISIVPANDNSISVPVYDSNSVYDGDFSEDDGPVITYGVGYPVGAVVVLLAELVSSRDLLRGLAAVEKFPRGGRVLRGMLRRVRGWLTRAGCGRSSRFGQGVPGILRTR